jgi:Domain of unknown function (DUF4157)
MNKPRSMVAPTAARQKPQMLARSASQSLPAAEQAFFESKLGGDFSRVRVHTDEAAAATAAGFGAKAFAAGEQIAFAAGRYQPGTTAGRELLAHELAHVAQQSRGDVGTTDAEPRARAAAETVAQGGQVSADEIGGAQEGVHCDPEDKEKAPPGLLPPFQPLTLSTLSPIDWFKMRQPFDLHGEPLTLRDADSIEKEWKRSSELLTNLGITDQFKLGFITKDWILNKGLSLQLQYMQERENPNAIDLSNRDWKQAYPGGFQTPIIPIFDIDWFRSNKKK